MIRSYLKEREHGVFYALLALLLGLCIIRYTFQINIPQLLLLGVACMIAVVGDQDEIIALCMCCIPLHSSFEFAVAILFCMIVYVVRFGREIRLNYTIFPILGIFLWETIHCFGADFAIIQYGGRFVPYVLIALLMCCGQKRFDHSLIVRAYVISTAAMCCSLIGKELFLSGFDLLAVFANLQRLGVIAEEEAKDLLVTGAEMNANSLGILCVLGLTGLIQLRLAGKGRRKDSVFIAILLMFGIMTSSRTFLVCLLLMALLMVFSQKRSIGRKIRFICVAVFVAVVVITVINWLLPDLLKFYIGRFSEEDITTGRDALMVVYHKYIVSNSKVLFGGLGAQDYGIKCTEIYHIANHTPHNAIQEIVVTWGIPGLMFFVALWGSMALCSRRLNKWQGMINYIPFIIIFVKSQAGQIISSDYTMLAFSFAYLSMCADLQPGAAERELANQGQVSDTKGIELPRVVDFILRKKRILVGVMMAVTVAAYGITAFVVTPKYEAKTQMFVNNPRIELRNPAYAIRYNEIFVSRSLVNTYHAILDTNETLNQVISQTGMNLSCNDLREMITTKPVKETEIFEIAVKHAAPEDAARIANAIADILPERIAAIVDGASASVVDYAVVPSSPSWPSRSTNTLIGFILGFILSVTMLVFWAMRDQKIRNEQDLSDSYEFPLLATIPDMIRNR